MSAPPAPSVPLPRREPLPPTEPPVWAVSGVETPLLKAPLQANCDRHGVGRDGVCCKELTADDERHLVDPDIVRDVVIGLSDGLTVPFALTAGLSSLGESKLVVLGGVAELIAGAISMGVGGFLASQSERDHYRYLRHHTTARIRRSCAGEMEREVSTVLGPIGVDEKLCRMVAENLRRVEFELGDPSASEQDVSGTSSANVSVNGHAHAPSDEESLSLRWEKDVGLTAFLLKYGQGVPTADVPTKRLYMSAFTIGMGYLIGGLIPLIPYFFIPRALVALVYSAIVTGITLLVFGAVKTHVSGAEGGVRGYAWGAVSTLAVGGTAAAAAYGIVKALEGEQ